MKLKRLIPTLAITGFLITASTPAQADMIDVCSGGAAENPTDLFCGYCAVSAQNAIPGYSGNQLFWFTKKDREKGTCTATEWSSSMTRENTDRGVDGKIITSNNCNAKTNIYGSIFTPAQSGYGEFTGGCTWHMK